LVAGVTSLTEVGVRLSVTFISTACGGEGVERGEAFDRKRKIV
jgi:hypothetical protein